MLLKLRAIVDSKCIIVGHGLENDFKALGLVVPREQVRDSAHLWKLSGDRSLPLRFLAAQLLEVEGLQSATHDSVEDARAALRLCKLHAAMLEKDREALRRPGAGSEGTPDEQPSMRGEDNNAVLGTLRELYGMGYTYGWPSNPV